VFNNRLAPMRPFAHRDSLRAPSAVDALLDHYVSWREECESVRVAYQRWDGAERSDSRLAYAGYLAALDREEHAARTYADQIGCVWRIGSR
jgi:hypothetical protein